MLSRRWKLPILQPYRKSCSSHFKVMIPLLWVSFSTFKEASGLQIHVFPIPVVEAGHVRFTCCLFVDPSRFIARVCVCVRFLLCVSVSCSNRASSAETRWQQSEGCLFSPVHLGFPDRSVSTGPTSRSSAKPVRTTRQGMKGFQ